MIVTARGVGGKRGFGYDTSCTTGKLTEKTTAYVVVIGRYSTVVVGWIG
jgi:hypothetical protein